MSKKNVVNEIKMMQDISTMSITVALEIYVVSLQKFFLMTVMALHKILMMKIGCLVYK